MVHNRYQIAGGEDSVVDAEVSLLRQSGHEVVMHHANNDGIKGPLGKLSAALSATYSSTAKRELAVVLDRE